MNIILVGYGKMGKAIERIAVSRGHNIVLKINRDNASELHNIAAYGADVAIEFTNPESAPENVMQCLEAGLPVICGSTGWSNKLPEAKEKCLAADTAFLWASNFSIGVNIFFEINKQLAALMNEWPEYDVAIEETHHTGKKDAPSGTAITIAEQILDNLERKKRWVKEKDSQPGGLLINAYREEDVPGTHTVTYASEIDEIEIKHTAHSRDGFASGAVLAAEFIKNRKGIFTMQDVLAADTNRL